VSYFCDLLIVVEPGHREEAAASIEDQAATLSFGTHSLSAEDASYIRRYVHFGSGNELLLVSVERAQLLLDDRDFAPEYDSGLPESAADRVGLLVRFFEALLASSWCRGLLVALTDSNEIDYLTQVSSDRLGHVMRRDCASASPPNALYVCGSSTTLGMLWVGGENLTT
jgi:23S rRNA C2498 (ribose-2'-O)-methylase RlmM